MHLSDARSSAIWSGRLCCEEWWASYNCAAMFAGFFEGCSPQLWQIFKLCKSLKIFNGTAVSNKSDSEPDKLDIEQRTGKLGEVSQAKDLHCKRNKMYPAMRKLSFVISFLSLVTSFSGHLLIWPLLLLLLLLLLNSLEVSPELPLFDTASRATCCCVWRYRQ